MVVTDISDGVILKTSHSRYARLKPVSMKNVHLDDGFWKSRLKISQEITLHSQYQLLESTGRLDNFIRASGKLIKPFQGYVFNDSDVYKWLEAAAWTMIYDQSDELRNNVDYVITLIVSAQQNDGYLNTYYSLDRSNERWTNLQDMHELYCAGHLVQAAIAHHRATNENKLMDVAIRLAEHLYTKFGPDKQAGTCGHPEVEMALIELFRTTGEVKFLELARLFINRRGHGLLGGREYLIDHLPLINLNRISGHAVRALYLCCGATDLFMETGEKQLLESLKRLWVKLVHQQMYITGGVGSRCEGEAFGDPYELPNARAYSETCAAITNMMWNWRMLQLEGCSHYADLLEWTLYNAVLSGISLDGSQYFYKNPLQNNGNHRRKPWFDCACCPPNVSRTLAMLPGYIFSISCEGVWLNLYTPSHAYFELDNGQRFGLRQQTTYPWDGHMSLEVTSDPSFQSEAEWTKIHENFSVFLRIPGWLGNNVTEVKINGEHLNYQSNPDSYLEIHRNWQIGDIVDIDFPMEIHYLEAHPLVSENSNKVAITRGPLVYCMESADNTDVSLSRIIIDPSVQP
jgi:DUF1680 family protein